MHTHIIDPTPTDTQIAGEVFDHFYPPAEFDALSGMVAEFNATQQRIQEVHQLITHERVSGVMGYFFSGNSGDQYGNGSALRHTNAFEEIFNLEGALNELTATYWQRVLNLTKLMDIMPQARRNEWHESLNAWRKHGYKRGADPKLDMAEFTDDNLRATLQSLMARRADFVAERVEGIFRALSSEHVTNQPQGFSKRMIINRMFNEWGGSCWNLRGYILDLRLVIAKFMGRDEPNAGTTEAMLKIARNNTGEWIECDAGTLRIKAFIKGTLHLEVHPEMAWRLNAILAHLYPTAIPDASRRRPTQRAGKSFHAKPLFERPLSNALLSCIEGMEQYYYLTPTERGRVPVENSLVLRSEYELSKHLKAEVATVMTALGGVLTSCATHRHMSYWQFDYNPAEVIQEVIVSGTLPDHKSYQFYPTPEAVTQALLAMADLSSSDLILEPSAGQGGIADHLPKDRTLCVEVSALHCSILRGKGHRAIQADFLGWEPGTDFTAILMNPPYSEGRWQAHLKKAASHLAPAGRLLAVLPASAKNSAHALLPGYRVEFGETMENAFAGTSITVVLARVTSVGS